MRSRLLRLERALPVIDVQIAAPPTTLTDAEEVERFGDLLWSGFAGEKRRFHLGTGQSMRSEPLRAWRDAAELACSAGHRSCPAELRPFSLVVWFESKPGIVKYRETHGVWIPTGEPVRANTLTAAEFDGLPLEERIAVLRQHRPGYWSRHGPPAGSRSRGKGGEGCNS